MVVPAGYAIAVSESYAANVVSQLYHSQGNVIGLSSITIGGVAYYRVVYVTLDGIHRVHLVNANTGQVAQ